MAEKIFNAQVNYGWGLTLNMTGKAPAVAKRIFDTLADAQAYADDANDSAIEGLVLSVVADGDNNGAYFVQQVGVAAIEADEEKGIEAVDAIPAILVKLGSASDAADGADAALKDAKDYTDQEVKKLADGAVKTNTDAIATLNGDAETEGSVAKAVATEKARAEAKELELNNAITAETAAREAADKAINDTIGEVPADKTVVKMIEDAQAAAEAAATKIADKTEGHVTVSVAQDESTGALTYTISESDIASAEGLQDEIDRAVVAEAGLQSQIGKAATEEDGPTGLHKEIADVKDAYEAAIEAMDAEVTSTEGSHVTVKVTEVDGVITAVNVTESDIASAQALADETKARTDADDDIKGRLDVIEGEAAGSIKKAVADAKAELLGEVADTDAKTLAALNDRIDEVVTNAKTYSIAKATDEEVALLGTNVKEAYKLVDEDDVKVGELIPVYKDSALQKVELVGQELQFTYLLTNGETSTVGVDVSAFLAESEFANGLQVIDHVVSVKVDAASEEFLTVGKDGIKLAGVQDAINAAKKEVADRLDVIEGEDTVEGSVKKALKDAKAYTDAEIDKLDAEVTSTDGSHVIVKVTEVDGVITAVNVTESDIASATGLTAEIGRATNAETALANRLTVIEGEAEGSIKKAVADAKTELLGDATEDYNTLGKLEDKVIAAEAAAKAAATKIADKTEGHVTVAVAEDESTGALTYTISESDIASAQGLANEVSARTSADDAIKGRLDVLEGVTVTGKDAIVVSASDAKTNKEVSLKLGTQPAEGEAGIVLSQDANGLVAKLQWGTF